MRKLSVLFTIFILALVCAPHAFGSASTGKAPLTLTKLISDMAEYEKKDIVLTGTILGACGSGCKVWIAEGDYKDGDPVALVWAKDDAFKFKTGATGKQVKLQGYAVAKYVDLCAIDKKEKKEKAAAEVAKQPLEEGKKDCDPPVKLAATTEKDGVRELKSITFFATSVEYLK